MKAFKKYITILAAAPMLWACSADEGREPGTDPNPAVTLYTYEPAGDYNPDNDVTVRFVTNNKTSSVKYLVLPSAEVKDLSESSLLSKVESEGKTVDNLGADGYADVTVTGLFGEYTIAAVANGSSLGNRVTFLGLTWNPLKEGTFYYNNDIVPAIAGIDAVEASLEICTTDTMLYRINGVFGEGTALKMNMLDKYGKDEDGKYKFFRVKQTATPWSYGNYGTVSVRDIGYWQNNEAFVTTGGYESGLYEDGYAFFCLQWNVAAGNLGYNYSYFIPND
ncbi:MAG: hypothetical protein K2H72_03095 [Muribaculaceae bacterium]|nr:hypothetical protein [Muribaculaceae bacterium]